MKLYLIAPKNPESFWIWCCRRSPRSHPRLTRSCCAKNVERIDFDTDADVVGITGFVIHKRRVLEIVAAFAQCGTRPAICLRASA